MTAPTPMACTAYHEAGHAVANVLAWQNATFTNECPESLLGRVEIFERSPGISGGGICHGPLVYSTDWPALDRIHPKWRDAMEWRIVSDLAGGIAEAILRGERRQKWVYGFATVNCGMKTDMSRTDDVLADLYTLTRRRHGAQRFAVRTLRLLLAQWPAVEALATQLQATHYIDGDAAERIISDHLVWCPILQRCLGMEGD